MQMNGGFFGSMLPQNATSFMPPGPSSSAMVSGIGDTPQGMTSPPMSQQLLAALASLAKMGGGNQPQSGVSSALPPNSYSPFMQNGGQPPAAPGGGAGAATPSSPLGGLDPNTIKAILAKMGIGAPGPLSGTTADGLGKY